MTHDPAIAVPLLSDEDCWNKLPPVVSGTRGVLPNWAKAVARDLPNTTAALLQLDFAQRTQSPLNPILRAKLRHRIACENRCDYAQVTALDDLKRSGLSSQECEAFIRNPSGTDTPEADPIEFVRLLTIDAPSVSENLFRKLQTTYGNHRLVAMVLLAAYGNFQDRLILGLNIPLESSGPLLPLEIRFDPAAFQPLPVLPPLQSIPESIVGGSNLIPSNQEWSELSFEDLQGRLEEQRRKAPLLPIPQWDEVLPNLPLPMQSRPTRIIWNLVGWFYVPELSIPWSVATRTMWAETTPDRILEESLFWVQTRSIRCNYCMGHCEMLLEVAGLNHSQIEDRTRRLAGNDWSAFSPAEQRAYAYARKLTLTPWDLKASEFHTLLEDFGDKQAMAIFFWLCRGLYMTRVSDGLKLPLEQENVFSDYSHAIRK